MRSCPYCKKEDLHDDARRCPYCGTWLTKGGRIVRVIKILTWILVVIFLALLVTCAGALILE